MSTSDKLTQIANNVAAVYAAGVAAGQALASNISFTKFNFGDTDFDNMSGSANIPHTLSSKPIAVFISSNKSITQLMEEGLTIPSGKTAYTLSATAFGDQYLNTYLRYNGTTLTGGSVAGSDPNSTLRLIYEITDTHVRIKPPASAYPWPNKHITEFTLICIGNGEETTE